MEEWDCEDQDLEIEQKGILGRKLLNIWDANEEEGAGQVVRTWNCLKIEGTFLIALRDRDFIWNYPFDISPSDTLQFYWSHARTVRQLQIQDWRKVGSFTAAQITAAEKIINITERDKLDICEWLKIKIQNRP